MNARDTQTLWFRWMLANAMGEMFGLGLTLVVGAYAISKIGDQAGIVAILAVFIVAVFSGAIEATLVGLAQWTAMHPWFPNATAFAWWRATLLGALLAYVLGWLPSTIMSLGEEA